MKATIRLGAAVVAATAALGALGVSGRRPSRPASTTRRAARELSPAWQARPRALPVAAPWGRRCRCSAAL